ncbi:MAG TPA: GyrI-like domain-containing protein [Thermoplasmata archaeon]|nr:GyrI-like domain-containing protein [Thermoplasmata archaeon]
MTVDFAWSKSPSLRVAAIAWTGPWNERKIRSQFERVERWAKARGVRTGRWIFREPGERRWEVAIELKGRVRGSAPVRTKTLPAATVARVVFDPEVVSPRLVYHGLSDWLRWRRKDKEIRSVVSTREIYSGNPWTEPKAWSRTEVQFLVRK